MRLITAKTELPLSINKETKMLCSVILLDRGSVLYSCEVLIACPVSTTKQICRLRYRQQSVIKSSVEK